MRDGRVERHFRAASSGFGVRVLVDGAWGFGARAGERDDAAARRGRRRSRARHGARRRLARRAARHASPTRSRSAAATPRRSRATSSPCRSPTSWRCSPRSPTGCAPPPGRARARPAPTSGRAARTSSLATTDGTSVEQLLVHTGGGCKIVVGDGDEIAHRSYPMELDGGVAGGGWEVIERFDLRRRTCRASPTKRWRCLTAPPCPAGDDHGHPRHAAAGAADPRVVRPPDRERPRVRRRGLARGRVASSRPIGSAASATARRHVNLTADATHARRRSAASAGTTRACRRARRRWWRAASSSAT